MYFRSNFILLCTPPGKCGKFRQHLRAEVQKSEDIPQGIKAAISGIYRNKNVQNIYIIQGGRGSLQIIGLYKRTGPALPERPQPAIKGSPPNLAQGWGNMQNISSKFDTICLKITRRDGSHIPNYNQFHTLKSPGRIFSKQDHDEHNLFHLLHVGRVEGQVGGCHGSGQLHPPLLSGNQCRKPHQDSCLSQCALVPREGSAIGDCDESAGNFVPVITVKKCDQGATLIGRQLPRF